MLFPKHLCVIRGGGDLGTGVALRLSRAGFPIVVCELANPLTIRRTVALSSAITKGTTTIEELTARRVSLDGTELSNLALTGIVPVLVEEGLPQVERSVLIDARMAKRPVDTSIKDAPLVVGIGPGFVAGEDCDAVVESMRGHNLGRVCWKGSAAPNTGKPGPLAGHSEDRIVRAPIGGTCSWDRQIGDLVEVGQTLGRIGNHVVTAPCSGLIRGLIGEQVTVAINTKVGDVDPRGSQISTDEVSDKALAIGGGTLEAVLTWLNQTG